MLLNRKLCIFFSISFLFLNRASFAVNNSQIDTKNGSPKVIIYVWDGLRPDSLTDKNANVPNLRAFAQLGVEFKHNHSAYPTFTMDNAQVFATGDYAGTSGFYGNVLYEPWREKNKNYYNLARNAVGQDITEKFLQPIFTEDYQILKDLDKPFNKKDLDEPLVEVSTLIQQAHANGLKTAVVGKSGPAFFQDFRSQGIILDENHVWPMSFAKELQAQNISLPKNTPIAYDENKLVLNEKNGDPTIPTPIVNLKIEGGASDPLHGDQSPFNKANEYMADIFIHKILPEKKPDLSVLWMRNPDTTEHIYGPGSKAYYNALESNDKILGQLLEQLKKLNWENSTDIIIVSDHAHSNIVATLLNDKNGTPRLLTPLHEITKEGFIGKSTKVTYQVDKKTGQNQLITNGFSTSGTIRTADLITKAHIKTEEGKLIYAYDGGGCQVNFAMSALRLNDGSLNTNSDGYHAADGNCLDKNKKSIAYTSPDYTVPKNLENLKDRENVVVAANGGTDYIYLPRHKPEIMKSLIQFFERREEYSALFVDTIRYPDLSKQISGFLPLSLVKLQNKSGRNPDIVVSMNYQPNVVVNGLPGTEFDSESVIVLRGTHGSFGPIDVHNTLLARGPHFYNKLSDNLPTGNVDVAPTVAKILNINLPNTDGRPLLEALKNSGVTMKNFQTKPFIVTSQKQNNLNIYKPTTHPIEFNLNNKVTDPTVHEFYTELHTHKLFLNNKVTSIYFDYAKGVRK